MMATVMKVIPYYVFEHLLEAGHLDKFYPRPEKSPVDLVVSSMPDAIKPRASELLTALTKCDQFYWNSKNEFVYDNKKYEGSNITDLVCNLLLGSAKKFNRLEHSQAFLSILRELKVPEHWYHLPAIDPVVTIQVEKIKQPSAWIKFEDKFSLQYGATIC